MTDGPARPDERGLGLWDFSLRLYARPGVAPLCLSLQARCDADVNVLLCALWIGATGRGRLDDDALAALDATGRPLREGVVTRLRAARVWLKAELARDRALAPLREAIKRVELAAEHAEQDRLEVWARRRPTGVGSVSDAIANAASYLAWRGGGTAPVDALSLEPFARGILALLGSADGPAAEG